MPHTVNLEDTLILRRVLDLGRQKRDQRSATREQIVSRLLRVGTSNCVEDNLGERRLGDLLDSGWQVTERSAVAIDNVSRTERLQVVGVTGGGVGDDGAETVEFEKLDG